MRARRQKKEPDRLFLFKFCYIHVANLRLLCFSLLAALASSSSSSETLEHNSYRSFMTLDQLRRLAVLSNNSHERNFKPSESFLKKHYFSWHPTFRDQVDIFFRGYMGINSLTNVLTPQKMNGYRKGSMISLKYTYRMNHPFISKVPAAASRLPEIIREITNNTAKPGDLYEWVGGIATVFDMGTSRVFLLFQKCRGITIKDNAGNVLHSPHFHFIRAPPPYQCFLHSMEGKNRPAMCGGSGALLRGHSDLSQPIRLVATETEGREIQEFFGDEVSTGNEGVSLVNLTSQQLSEYVRLEDESTVHYRDTLDIIEDEFKHGIEDYDNMAFFTLSVAAILSSAAVAGVSLGPGRERIAVVTIEASVVYSFLLIVSHAYMALMRKQTHVVDMDVASEGYFTYNGMIIETYTDIVITAVGERLYMPILLLTTEVFAILAAITVTCILVLNFRELKRLRKGKRAKKRRAVWRWKQYDWGSSETTTTKISSSEACVGSRGTDFEEKLRQPVFCDCPRKKQSSFDVVTAKWVSRQIGSVIHDEICIYHVKE